MKYLAKFTHLLCLFLLLACRPALGQGMLTTLYSFTGGSDGAFPFGRLFQPSGGGDFYGTTSGYGTSGYGTVFKIASDGTFTPLHEFTGGTDGGTPKAGLFLGSDGYFYGTTYVCGASTDPGSAPGVVFKIGPDGTFSVVHTFAGPDGAFPESSVIQLSDGDLYGATTWGGANFFSGTVFKMTPAGTIVWTYSFSAEGSSGANLDGAVPCVYGGLILGSDSNLYGTTSQGGLYGQGTIFRITTDGTLTSLYSFTGGSDGGSPAGYLVQGSDGNFYGTCASGGVYYSGTLFKLSSTDGSLTTLHAFAPGEAFPEGGVIQGSDGMLYGTTHAGTVFQASTDGTVFYTIHTLSGLTGTDLFTGVIQAADGFLYGVGYEGGAYADGTVFKCSTSGAPTLISLSPSSATADGGDFILTVNGAGFDYSSAVTWNGTPLTTDFVSASQLMASVPAADIATSGTASVTVTQGGLTSNALTFTINNPAPTLSSIKPTSTNAGGPAFTLTVTGSSFVSTSTVHWNGSALATTFVSASKLTAAVPAGLVASPGTATVTVVSPSPDGGTSGSKSFKILLTTVKLTSASLVLNSDGSYTATVSLHNVGYNTAPSVTINKATLEAAGTTSTLPMSVGSIAPGATVTATLNFPATAGTPGSMVKLAVSGKFTGGTFAGSLKVTLP